MGRTLTVRVAVVGAACSNSRVAGSDDNRDTLHTQLHELTALTLLVVRRQVVFLLAVRDRNDLIQKGIILVSVSAGSKDLLLACTYVCRLVDATL